MARKRTPSPLRGKPTFSSVPEDVMDAIRAEASRTGKSLVWIMEQALVAREVFNRRDGEETGTA